VNLLVGLTACSLVAWIVLVVGRGFFWWPSPRLEPGDCAGDDAPSVAAVIPARDEAEILPEALPSVLEQAYGGVFRVVLVDDRSEDGTATVAREAAAGTDDADRLTVLAGEPLPAGWMGKVWAMEQGVVRARREWNPKYLWFIDADVAHDPWVLGSLVARAEDDDLDLVSVMATLRVESFWDRLLIPAFVYFFAKLYPFRFVGNRRRRTAGAAGGCMLVRAAALEQAGGLGAIRSALIDDCALGRSIKRSGGRVWLGFSRGVRSVRRYGRLSEVWRMVARSAYTQLRHSPLLLAGTVAGMLFLYALPPAGLFGGAIAAGLGIPSATLLLALGGAAWGLMTASFVPILRHHGVGPWIAPLLPVGGILYTGMTISSAWRHVRGRGGAWKGRTY